VFCVAFHKLQFGFVIFCPKNIGGKVARKALENLTRCWVYDNNFIYILRAAFKSILFHTKIQSQNVIREKLHNAFWFEKGALKM